jgi:phosphoglycolate phosphatase
MLVEKPMLNNTLLKASKGGDIRKAHRLEPAILSAFQSIYKGGGSLREHNSASPPLPPTPLRESFIKETANQHKTKTETLHMSEAKLKAKGIFFDLDGTIVDSREAYVEAARTAFQAMGQEPPEAEAALEIPRRLEQKQPINDIVKGDINKFLDVYLKTYYAISKEKTTPIPNISTTLKTLSKKAKLALITMRSVPKKTITKELQHFGIAKYFTHVVTALDTHKPKPSPEALTKCIKALDVQMCDCIIVGDSVNDIKAGKAAGAKTVAVLSGLFSHEELAKEQPDLILKDATALPNFIE